MGISMIFEFASRAKLPSRPYQSTEAPDLITVLVAAVPLAILIGLCLVGEVQYFLTLVGKWDLHNASASAGAFSFFNSPQISARAIGNYPVFRRAVPDSLVDSCLLLPRLPVARIARRLQSCRFIKFIKRIQQPTPSHFTNLITLCTLQTVCYTRPRDLHALSTPPAFILS